MSKPMRLRHLVFWLLAAALVFPAAAQVKDHEEIEFPELPEFKIPSPEVYELANGMMVYLMEDHELPLISVSARIRTGSNHVPADKTGLGGIFGQAQREGGTTSMSGDEMDDFLEARAASVETDMSGDVASASMSCLAQDFDEVFAVFNDVLRNPAFEESKIELAKVQANTGISRRNDNVAQITGREFRRLIYGTESPLGRLAEYTTVANVQRQDLLDWHKKYYHPNNVMLGVVGDFDSATMKKKIEAVLGGWPRGQAFDPPEVPVKRAPAGVYFIPKEDVTQANIRLGHQGIRTGNPDYFAVSVMNEVLGGGFTSRLWGRIRSDKGLTYNPFGSVGASFIRPGIFQAGLSTKSETMGEAVDALKEEIEGIISEPPTAEEMTRSKESILNSFIFNYTSRQQILNQQMTYAYYGMPADFLDKYRANIEKVTAEDVTRVAKKYVHPDDLALLVVGKAEDFDRPVDSFGPVTKIDISIPDPPDTRPAVEKNAATLEAGSRLLARAAAKIGPAVKAMRADMTLGIDIGGGQKMSAGQTVSVVLPDKLRQVLRLPFGEQVVVVNKDRGQATGGGQSQALSAEQVSDSIRDIARNPLVIAGNANSPELEAVSAGNDEVAGAPCEIVAVTFRGGESRLFVDEEGNVLKQAYQGKHPVQQTPGLIEILYSDYRSVNGRMVSHKQVLNFEGQEVVSIALNSIEFDPELDAALFEIPAE